MVRSCVVFLLLAASSLAAETGMQNGPKPWSLDDCLRFAYERSPRIAERSENLRAVKGQYWGSAGEFFPHVFLNNSYTYNSIAPLGGAGTLLGKGLPPSMISQDYYDIGVSVSQQVFSWRMRPTFALSRAAVRQAESQCKKVQNDLTLDVKKAYFGVLFARQSLEIAQTAEAVASDGYETSQQLYKEGKVSHFDVSRAKVSWVNAKTGTITAKNGLRSAEESLKTVLGLPQAEAIAVEGRFSEEAAGVDAEEQIRRALAQRPELRELESLKKIGKENVELSRSGLLPALAFSYRYFWQGAELTARQSDYYDAWVAGAYLTIPLFDGGSSLGRLASAKAGLESVQAADRAATDGIILEVRQSCLALADAAERLPAQKENVETARENLRIAQERYALGLLSHLELKDAELSLTQAQTQSVKALFDYNVARASLDKAVGLPFPADR